MRVMLILVTFIFWVLLTSGVTYTVSESELLQGWRIRLVGWFPVLALLLTCRACVGFWVGQGTAAALIGMSYGLTSGPPWHTWLYLPPMAGFAAVGVVDILTYTRRHGADD